MDEQTPRTGRCQHCQQVRPLFQHDGELQFWGYNPGDEAWLCARDYSARETAIENDRPFHIEHDLVVFPEDQPAAVRFYGPDGNELTASR